MKIKSFMIALALLAALPAMSFAGGFCCQLNTGIGEGLNGSAGSGKFQVGVNSSFARMKGFYEGDSKVEIGSIMTDPRFNVAGGVVPEEMEMSRVTLNASYAPVDRLRLIVGVPWVVNNMTMWSRNGMMWMKMKMHEVSGLGDVTVTGQYRLYQDRDIMPLTVLSAGVGLKLPTGSYEEKNSAGSLIHAHMQPGTGSWDPILSVAFVKMLSQDFLLRADANYQFATENPLGYQFGDTFAVNGNLDYNLIDPLNLTVGASYFHSGKAKDHDNNYKGNDPRRLTDYDGYTGEDSLWVSPGIQIIPFSGARIDLTGQLPVYYKVGGIQQVTDYRLLAAFSYGF